MERLRPRPGSLLNEDVAITTVASPGTSWSAPGPAPASDGGGTEVPTDLAILEGAGECQRARQQVRSLSAWLGEHPGAGDEFRVDVVYTDGCRMPW
jgi:hypothetical protein